MVGHHNNEAVVQHGPVLMEETDEIPINGRGGVLPVVGDSGQPIPDEFWFV